MFCYFNVKESNCMKIGKITPTILSSTCHRTVELMRYPFVPSSQNSRAYSIPFRPSSQNSRAYSIPFRPSSQNSRAYSIPFRPSSQNSRAYSIPFRPSSQNSRAYSIPFRPSSQNSRAYSIPLRPSSVNNVLFLYFLRNKIPYRPIYSLMLLAKHGLVVHLQLWSNPDPMGPQKGYWSIFFCSMGLRILIKVFFYRIHGLSIHVPV